VESRRTLAHLMAIHSRPAAAARFLNCRRGRRPSRHPPSSLVEQTRGIHSGTAREPDSTEATLFTIRMKLSPDARFPRRGVMVYPEPRGVETMPIMGGNIHEQLISRFFSHRPVGDCPTPGSSTGRALSLASTSI
jgi:hypothetical protein